MAFDAVACRTGFILDENSRRVVRTIMHYNNIGSSVLDAALLLRMCVDDFSYWIRPGIGIGFIPIIQRRVLRRILKQRDSIAL